MRGRCIRFGCTGHRVRLQMASDAASTGIAGLGVYHRRLGLQSKLQVADTEQRDTALSQANS